MGAPDDSEQVANSLADWIGGLTFVDRSTDEVTGLLVEAVVAWGAAQGWRVYRRAASVLPLPPPYAHRHSCVDVACARPGALPLVIEVDRADRQRSVDKLLAEAAAGRTPLWVRWGSGPLPEPPLPVRMVACRVTSRTGLPGRGRLHSRLPASDRPPPAHTHAGVPPTGPDRQQELFTGEAAERAHAVGRPRAAEAARGTPQDSAETRREPSA